MLEAIRCRSLVNSDDSALDSTDDNPDHHIRQRTVKIALDNQSPTPENCLSPFDQSTFETANVSPMYMHWINNPVQIVSPVTRPIPISTGRLVV